MGCLKLIYDYQEQGEKKDSLKWSVWVNPESEFLGVDNQQTNGGSPQVLQAGPGDYLLPAEKHFNGSLGLVAGAVDGYNKIPNDAKRKFAYKLSKITGAKAGEIFQGSKAFTNSTGKLASKLGPAGTLLTLGVIGYEVHEDLWNAHTIVNGSLLVVTAAATFFAAPAVLTGVALYGIGDYAFDFSGKIDSGVGRDSGLWGK